MATRIRALFWLLCASLLLSGCGTVRITSDPPGARAYSWSTFNRPKPKLQNTANMTSRGVTPTSYMSWFSDVEHALVVWSDGSRSAPKYETTSLNTTDHNFHFEKNAQQTHTLKPAFQPQPTVTTTAPVVQQPSLPVTLSVRSRSSVAHVAKGVRWAVVIGVSRYKDSRIPQLRYASADAQSFHDWLVSPTGGGYAPARVRLLIDEQATGRAIRNVLFRWLKQPIAEDVVTIYLAGHGSPESPDSIENLHFLPHDADYTSIETTGFPMWDIETALKRYIKAKKVVVIADACHSGGVGRAFDIARRSDRGIKVNPISTGIHQLTKVGDGICVISASDEKQLSQESKDWGGGHGVFTFFLLNGLNGNADFNEDASVTLGELTSYLSQKVRRATKNAQSPTVAGRYDPALTIGK